jgi:hypothetical protein
MVVVRRGGGRSIRGACAFKLIQDNLGDSLPHSDACPAHLSLAEVVAPCFEMIVLDLLIFKQKLPGCSLVCEIVAIGMFAPSSIRTGVRHLVGEVSVVAGHTAPPGSSSRAEMVRCLTMGGEMVEPGAVGTAAMFLVFVLRQFVVLRVLAVPRDGTLCPPSQVESPMLVIRAFSSTMSLVSPCQFPSLAIFVDQLQEVFVGICSYEALLHRFGVSDVHQLVHPELGSPLLGVGLEGLYLL